MTDLLYLPNYLNGTIRLVEPTHEVYQAVPVDTGDRSGAPFQREDFLTDLRKIKKVPKASKA
jgi:hypothetical protein